MKKNDWDLPPIDPQEAAANQRGVMMVRKRLAQAWTGGALTGDEFLEMFHAILNSLDEDLADAADKYLEMQKEGK